MAYASKLVGYAPPPRPATPVLAHAAAPPTVPPSGEDATQGQRKLVRPHLSKHLAASDLAPRRLRGTRPLVAHEPISSKARRAQAATGNAEALFFEKQVQAQTPLIFVLEDGEQVYGVIEWYDRESIKIRGAERALLFKRAIKYLYKASDARSS